MFLNIRLIYTLIFRPFKIAKNKIAIFFFLATSVLIAQDGSYNSPKYNRTSEAYGFLLGQEFILGQIKMNQPQYKTNAERVELLFNMNFGTCKEKMVDYLKNYMGIEGFDKYITAMNFELIEKLGSQKLENEMIETFISEVESRSKGNMPSTILETLLSFQFSDYPANEFTYGFTKIFQTKGHKKSKNTDWQIKVPISWKSQEADRPNIIQKFISDYGSGFQSIMIMVNEFPQNQVPTNEEIKFLLTTEGLKTLIPEGAKYVSSGSTIIDNLPSGVLEIEQVVHQLEYEIKIRMIQFIFFYKNTMFRVQCSISAVSETTNLDLEMKKYLPLFKMVANSVVINQQWK